MKIKCGLKENSSAHIYSDNFFRPIVQQTPFKVCLQQKYPTVLHLSFMNKQIQTIISNLKVVNSGEPWFGRAVYKILDEVNPETAFIKPNNTTHSLIELLWHMITWADFTLQRIEKEKINDLAAAEQSDWRVIDPKVHTWKKGVAAFKAIHKKMIELLKKKDDTFLKEKVDYRKYDFQFLLNGLIQHTIYHLGQLAYLKKLLS